MTKLKIPFHEIESSSCYERISETLPVYRKCISDIRVAMESNNLFEERLRKILRLHGSLLKDAQNEESSQTWNEEDVYLCVLYDMFEAMYTAEADRIVAGSGISQQKARSLYDLGNTIARLPFGSTHYLSTVRPKLQKIISDASNRVS